MGPIVWDEDLHVVGGAVASLAGTVVAAECVVAGGVLPTDPSGSYCTLIFIYKKTCFNRNSTGAETVNVITCENIDMISYLLKNHHPLSCALFVNILTCSYNFNL